MAKIRGLKCLRPVEKMVAKVAALPYDVYNLEETREIVTKNANSFLSVDNALVHFAKDEEITDDRVYKKAREMINTMTREKVMMQDTDEKYYVYELTMNGRKQTGLVATVSIDDYINNVVKKHENTRADKEIDRFKHVDICNAQTGPIFLAYRDIEIVNKVIEKAKNSNPIYNFVSSDNVRNVIWKLADQKSNEIVTEQFASLDSIYVADGHHRCAAAVNVGLKRREDNPNYTGEEWYNYFLSVLFPASQLEIMDYNRVVKDLNGYEVNAFVEKLSEEFEIESVGDEAYKPAQKGDFGMYLDNQWYRLRFRAYDKITNDVDFMLDVSILQTRVLDPILNIVNPKTDNRIDFVGGIRGLKELEKRCADDMKLAFSLYPTSIEELFAVSDAGKLMPPKSTWFEPKLLSGIFIAGELQSDEKDISS